MPPRLAPLNSLLDDIAFLKTIDRGERLLAKVLALVLGIVTVVAAAQIGVDTLAAVLTPGSRWVGTRLTVTLGHLLDILIALEVLQNITGYLRRGVVQIELVLATAITAVARKVIVLPPGSENKPQLLALVRGGLSSFRPPAKREPTRPSPALDPWPAADDGDGGESTAGPRG